MSEHTDHANVKIHPPVLTFIFIVLAYVANWLIPLQFSTTWLRYLGFTIAIIGFFIPFFAVREFVKAKTTLNPHGSVSTIITSGIFQYTRNPIYIGFVLMSIGFPLFSGTYWGLILSPVLVFCFNKLVIQYEEAYLEEKFGEQYTSYKSKVRRWV